MKENNLNETVNIKRENTEFRTQAHEMWVEGSCDNEPTIDEVIQFAKKYGYDASFVQITLDGLQTVWRFNADIKPVTS